MPVLAARGAAGLSGKQLSVDVDPRFAFLDGVQTVEEEDDDSYGDDEADDERRPTRQTRGSRKQSSSARSLRRGWSGKLLKSARSFTLGRKKAVPDADDAEHSNDDYSSCGSSSVRGSLRDSFRGSFRGSSDVARPPSGEARLRPEERRSLTRKSAQKLGLTLDGDDVYAPNRRKSFARRRSEIW